eukprot:scaffold1880_cov115-Isochrysis_galbana.AAC.6
MGSSSALPTRAGTSTMCSSSVVELAPASRVAWLRMLRPGARVGPATARSLAIAPIGGSRRRKRLAARMDHAFVPSGAMRHESPLPPPLRLGRHRSDQPSAAGTGRSITSTASAFDLRIASPSAAATPSALSRSSPSRLPAPPSLSPPASSADDSAT